MTIDKRIDPISLELMKNAVNSITDDMMMTMVRTAPVVLRFV